MKINKKNFIISIPPEIIFNPFISQTEKILFGIIQKLTQKNKILYATNKYLSTIMMCKKQNIGISIRDLKKYGYILTGKSIDKNEIKKRYITINPGYKEIYKDLNFTEIALTKNKKRKTISPSLRFKIFNRDGFKCTYCGKKSPDVILEIDHIKPFSKNGECDISNYTTTCVDCNRGKRDILLSDKNK